MAPSNIGSSGSSALNRPKNEEYEPLPTTAASSKYRTEK